MKYHIRNITTGSGNIAVQVITYENRIRVVVKHIGSAQTKEELTLLRNNAADWIAEQTEQLYQTPAAKSL